MKKNYLLMSLLVAQIVQAQDVNFAKKTVATLCSKKFWGRGYTKNGMHNAAIFLKSYFKDFNITPMNGTDYFQHYSYSVNTFPNAMKLKINGTNISAGKDFIVAAHSMGNKTQGNLVQIKNDEFVDSINHFTLKLKEKLTMTVSQQVYNETEVEVDKETVKGLPKTYFVEIDNKFIENFEAENICGFVKGTLQPDSFIFITAHYDHLGGLGKNIYFPGANDNASGVSLLLTLAKYYSKHPQPYSIGFILFSGEEAGLLGSKYFTQHPLIDLKKIKFLINTDLAGTGVDGITVCNATEYKNEFNLLQNINNEMKLLTAINARGKAANSDHYWFSESGVPSFFFYTLGGIKAYHDVFDRAETLPLTKHEALFTLVTEFNKRLMNSW